MARGRFSGTEMGWMGNRKVKSANVVEFKGLTARIKRDYYQGKAYRYFVSGIGYRSPLFRTYKEAARDALLVLKEEAKG